MPEKAIKNNGLTTIRQAVLALALLLAGGCATLSSSSSTSEKNVEALELKVAQLHSERVNWEARNNALDDQVLVLEKKLERCREGHRQDLKVVRLIPGQEPVTVQPESRQSDYAEPFAPRDAKKQEKRQKLVLRGSHRAPANRSTPKPTSAASFGDFAPDNLGVVDVAEASKDQVMEAFNNAYRAYTNGQYGEALTQFASFVRNHQTHKFADNAIFWRGECYLAMGQYFKAIGEFERLIRRYESSDKRPSSLYRIGFAWDNLGDKDKALEYYFRVVGGHAGTDAARRASRRVSAIQGEGGQASKLMPTAHTR